MPVRQHRRRFQFEARRHVLPHFLDPEARNGASRRHAMERASPFLDGNIRHAHIEPYPRDRQKYFTFVSFPVNSMSPVDDFSDVLFLDF